MQLHQQPEEVKAQTPLSDLRIRQEPVVAVQSEANRVAVTEPQSLTDLLATADKENATRRKWAPVSILWLFVQAAFMAFPHSPGAVLSYCVSIFLGAFIGIRFTIRYRNTTAALADVDDVRMVGPLLDRLRSGVKARHTRRVVMQALMRLLPRLKASDASLLTTAQKAELAHYLGRLAKFQQDKEFQIVILRALEQVGDAQALPVVEKIIQRTPHWSAQERVHKAALECRSYLLQRAQDESARKTLLRSASGFEGDTSQLLHPASGAPGVDSRQLLRADPQSQTLAILDTQSQPEALDTLDSEVNTEHTNFI